MHDSTILVLDNAVQNNNICRDLSVMLPNCLICAYKFTTSTSIAYCYRLCELKELQKFDLYDSQFIEGFPEVICQLTDLKELHLGLCQLTELPKR